MYMKINTNRHPCVILVSLCVRVACNALLALGIYIRVLTAPLHQLVWESM